MALTEMEKFNVTRLASSATRELMKMAQVGPPLWLRGLGGGDTEILNEQVYVQMFPEMGPKVPGLTSEASRDSIIIFLNAIDIIKILMDVRKWKNAFFELVLSASTLEVLSTGAANSYDGALQMMSAEFHLPSPLVPARNCHFARYCKQQSDGIWVVVDVSTHGIPPTHILTCRRRPSGCLIQEMPNGYSKVTWIEHVEADDRMVEQVYKRLIRTTLAYGAKRWVRILDRQCERLAGCAASNILVGNIGAITNGGGRKNLYKLAERMMISFCHSVSHSPAGPWTTLTGNAIENVKVRTVRSSDNARVPFILTIATSFWFPPSPRRVFSYLRDVRTRHQVKIHHIRVAPVMDSTWNLKVLAGFPWWISNEVRHDGTKLYCEFHLDLTAPSQCEIWDFICQRAAAQEVAHMETGRDPGNCISILQGTESNGGYNVILQESCIDSSGCLVIYAPVASDEMNGVMNGADPENISVLPCGFAIFPDGVHATAIGDVGGTLLTVAFQISDDLGPNEVLTPPATLTPASVMSVNNLMTRTVENIKAAFAHEFYNTRSSNYP